MTDKKPLAENVRKSPDKSSGGFLENANSEIKGDEKLKEEILEKYRDVLQPKCKHLQGIYEIELKVPFNDLIKLSEY